jgi:uncharacterized protein (TIGR02598 family)
MSPRTFTSPHLRSAFSLIEVLLAIGLMTFALLVIFSLLPAGMSSLQDANRQIVQTEIYNTLGAELSSTPFDRLANYQSTRFPAYFDNEGNEVASGDSIFTVRCQLEPPELGGELRRAMLMIGYRRDPSEAPANTASVSKRTFLLVDRGL